MKQLADALGRAGDEVSCEAVATIAYLALAALVLLSGGGLVSLALAFVASRVLYGVLAWRWLAALPAGEPVRAQPWRHADALGLAQVGCEVVFGSPVIVLRALVGSDAAGLLAAAQKLVLAAEAPARLLGRLVLPHLAHASLGGDTAATLDRAVRASAHVVLPIAVGGCIVAEPLLVWLCGPAYASAAWPLRLLLGNAVVVGTLSHYAQALLAHGALRGYLATVAVSVLTYAASILMLLPAAGASGAAFASVAGMTIGSFTAMCALRLRARFSLLLPWPRPILHAAMVAVPALALQPCGVMAQLGAGAVAFALGLFALELLGRDVGAGLQRSSGFMVERDRAAPAPARQPDVVEVGP